jgi:hypothetical protein
MKMKLSVKNQNAAEYNMGKGKKKKTAKHI